MSLEIPSLNVSGSMWCEWRYMYKRARHEHGWFIVVLGWSLAGHNWSELGEPQTV